MADAIRHVCTCTQDDGDKGEKEGDAVGEEQILRVVDVDVDGLCCGHVRQYGWSKNSQRQIL